MLELALHKQFAATTGIIPLLRRKVILMPERLLCADVAKRFVGCFASLDIQSECEETLVDTLTATHAYLHVWVSTLSFSIVASDGRNWPHSIGCL